MTSTIEELVGKHLGRTSDGKTMLKYEAPMKHDASLLVPIPRSYNREKSNLTNWGVGCEIWHAYEFSFLKLNGQPVTGILKLKIPSDSHSMVESKSLKLYLNSFDFEKFLSAERLPYIVVESIISNDLSKLLGCEVLAYLHDSAAIGYYKVNLFEGGSHSIINLDMLNVNVESFKEDDTLLKVKQFCLPQIYIFTTSNLRSNCEITNQKDTGHSYILFKGKKYAPNAFELAQYIFSMRNSQHFHENVTEIMYNKIYEFYEPEELIVANIYNRRGGIDIHSFRGNSQDVLQKYTGVYLSVRNLQRGSFQI